MVLLLVAAVVGAIGAELLREGVIKFKSARLDALVVKAKAVEDAVMAEEEKLKAAVVKVLVELKLVDAPVIVVPVVDVPVVIAPVVPVVVAPVVEEVKPVE